MLFENNCDQPHEKGHKLKIKINFHCLYDSFVLPVAITEIIFEKYSELIVFMRFVILKNWLCNH